MIKKITLKIPEEKWIMQNWYTPLFYMDYYFIKEKTNPICKKIIPSIDNRPKLFWNDSCFLMNLEHFQERIYISVWIAIDSMTRNKIKYFKNK